MTHVHFGENECLRINFRGDWTMNEVISDRCRAGPRLPLVPMGRESECGLPHLVPPGQLGRGGMGGGRIGGEEESGRVR